MKKQSLRLGAGSAHEGDDLDAAALLAEKGELDYIIFDCTSEKAISLALIRRANAMPAFDSRLESKLRAVAPACMRNGTKIIANAGGFDPVGAAELTAEVCRDLGLKGVKIAYVTGADVSDTLRLKDPIVLETGKPVSALGNDMLGALAYGGTQSICDALADGADIVITQRAGNSEQFLAPMLHEFGWSLDEHDKIASGLGVGHLVECGAQISGGYFADPGYKDVPDLHRLGFPIVEMDESGAAIITKLPGAGGVISEQTCTEQLLYKSAIPPITCTAPASSISPRRASLRSVPTGFASTAQPAGPAHRRRASPWRYARVTWVWAVSSTVAKEHTRRQSWPPIWCATSSRTAVV